MIKNKIHLEFDALSQNEAFARVTVAAFATQLDPTLEEISDIKTAVSEGVTNAIIHGYDEKGGTVMIDCAIHDDDVMEISIHDDGIGIEDIEMAREPLYTTKPERDRSGMGFTFMQMFMDGLEVFSEPGKGTTVVMKKAVRKADGLQGE